MGGQRPAVAGGTALSKTAQLLRNVVAASRLVANRRSVGVTVSIGATMATPGDDPAALLRRADLLVYQAKQGGRNRVVSDTPSFA